MGTLPLSFSLPMQDPRCGFHYYPDTYHYRETDLRTWLPRLQLLGVSWLVLRSEVDRAIPESFLWGLKLAGIQPIIQFQLPLEGLPSLKEIGILLEVYARWGARYVIFYDRPNSRSSWPVWGWMQQDLVERFLDRFLPVAGLAYSAGMIPVFPPLEPGGSYWDTAFLRSALLSILRRKGESLLQVMALSAYAWTGGHSLDWGSGGPEAWPQARPYRHDLNSQDQRGFRIFDWYTSIAENVLHQSMPILLLQAGLSGDPQKLPMNAVSSPAYSKDCKAICRLLVNESVQDEQSPDSILVPIPPQVIACNFWLLGSDPASPYAGQAFYSADRNEHALIKWLGDWRKESKAIQVEEKTVTSPGHSIDHYLLLPGYEWGVSDWYLEIIRPFVKKYLPTVGFSPAEAERAARVTIVGNAQNYPEDLLQRLEKSGCVVDQISGDGTKIASELAER